MFGLGKILGAVVDVALTPVELVRDVAEVMDGSNPGRSHTVDRLNKATQKVSDAADELAGQGSK